MACVPLQDRTTTRSNSISRLPRTQGQSLVLRFWDEAAPIWDTHAEIYLRRRGLTPAKPRSRVHIQLAEVAVPRALLAEDPPLDRPAPAKAAAGTRPNAGRQPERSVLRALGAASAAQG